jgi:predicted metal-dependent hydrolase
MDGRSRIAVIAGRPARYRIRQNRRARHLILRVDPHDGLVVVVPPRTPLREVQALLVEHADWLDRQLEKHGVRDGPIRRFYAGGSELLFLGRPRRLRVLPLEEGRRRSRLHLDGDLLVARLSPAEVFDPRPVLERWLRREARRHLGARVAELGAHIGLAPTSVVVGERTSRWGSCSAHGTLSFCFRLVMAPPEVIDAVVAHELCHLRHLNHGRRFYRLLKLACPDHAERMAWLRAHETDLQF